MLVGTFEIQIGARPFRVAVVVRATQYMPMGGAGVEPDVERVADLVVLRCFGAQEFGRVELEPGFDTFLLDALGHLFHQFDGARVLLAGFLVQEEGNGDAPVALTGDTPVWSIGDHGVQPRLSPCWVELGGFHCPQCTFAQRRAIGGSLVHTDEPLCGSSIDQRCLVAPAVHVAVGDLAVGQQRPDLAQLVNNGRVGLPDVHAAEVGQIGHVLSAPHDD
ncbi:hypothetical protein SDC9_179297 [bioreactor metagenome]|uniref:Uncharacterized protein n=1 Tax=bioreactor metagenome TaxID=1076179 RepID=A0A645H0J3_9ZZZZ